MPIGGGKYDEACTLARTLTNARALILIVIDGHQGSGFSVQTTDENLQYKLPEMLELMAREIRETLKGTL